MLTSRRPNNTKHSNVYKYKGIRIAESSGWEICGLMDMRQDNKNYRNYFEIKFNLFNYFTDYNL